MMMMSLHKSSSTSSLVCYIVLVIFSTFILSATSTEDTTTTTTTTESKLWMNVEHEMVNKFNERFKQLHTKLNPPPPPPPIQLINHHDDENVDDEDHQHQEQEKNPLYQRQKHSRTIITPSDSIEYISSHILVLNQEELEQRRQIEQAIPNINWTRILETLPTRSSRKS